MPPLASLRAKRTLLAFVLLTLLYGSACSATCALGACPNDAQNAATHDCDHNASNPTHQRAPQNPDCPKHHHPTFDALKTDAISQSQLIGANRAPAARLLAVTLQHDDFAASSHSTFSDPAPPPDLNFALYEKISVLRI
ncbi:MAG: hypothetical protein WB621_09535 [Candidatus Acidiferrales bacterium]